MNKKPVLNYLLIDTFSKNYLLAFEVRDHEKYNGLQIELKIVPFADEEFDRSSSVPIQYNVLSNHKNCDDIQYIVENVFTDIIATALKNSEENTKENQQNG